MKKIESKHKFSKKKIAAIIKQRNDKTYTVMYTHSLNRQKNERRNEEAENVLKRERNSEICEKKKNVEKARNIANHVIIFAIKKLFRGE